ncbi:hypothetical protein MIR68_004842 [Amoeboaphelidium protococcarum]|nr:hypothetical protein MIR68_004842 [Amoeboaphelidium protococcarum]
MVSFDYQLNNLLGAVYKKGNVVFMPDKKSLISPVGNKVSCFDLVGSLSFTFPFETQRNITVMDVSPDGQFIMCIDEDGRAVMAHVQRRVIVHRFTFKSRVTAMKFSPDGMYVAVALHHKHMVQIWQTPLYNNRRGSDNLSATDGGSFEVEMDFAPFSLHHQHSGHQDDICHFTWSSDGQMLISAAKDMTMRLWNLHTVEDYKPLVLSGHRDTVVGCWWSEDYTQVYSVGKDGALFIWNSISNDDLSQSTFIPAESTLKLHQKHYFAQKGEYGTAQARCADFHPESKLLTVGFSNGVFALYELPDFNLIHTLSISQKKIDTVAFSLTGDWIALASSTLGQLLVWDWKSESYVMKQQGHYYDMNCVAYSTNGQLMASGGDDGKVKIWNANTGFCFITFQEHQSPVSAVCFAGKQGGKQSIVFSASYDGTVRAYDLVRYRNFRTFTAPQRVQFSSIAVEPNGDILCAGSLDSFEIYVWSVQTGKLLEVLPGHEGPVSSLCFSPEPIVPDSGCYLYSASWDKSVKIWDIYSRGEGTKCIETFKHKSDVLAVTVRYDGKEVCSATLDGQLLFWDPLSGEHSKRVQLIEGRRDIVGGRKSYDVRTAANSAQDKYFTTVCYTADGAAVLAGGNSKYVCLYDLNNHVLLKKFQLTRNLSLDGVQDKLNSRNVTQAGVVDLNDSGDEQSDLEDRLQQRHALPGAQKNDRSSRRTKPDIRCKALQFSPVGASFAVVTTEGLMEYAVSESTSFDPVDLSVDLTPDSVINMVKQLKKGIQTNLDSWQLALTMSLRLGEVGLMQFVYESVPVDQIEFLVQNLHTRYICSLLRLIALLLDQQNGDTIAQMNKTAKSPHIQFHLLFIKSLLYFHGEFIRKSYGKVDYSVNEGILKAGLNEKSSIQVVMRVIKKHLQQLQTDVSSLAHQNLYTIEYLRKQCLKSEVVNKELIL